MLGIGSWISMFLLWKKYPETTRGLIKRIRKALDHSPQLPEFSIPQNMKNCGVDLQEDPAC